MIFLPTPRRSVRREVYNMGSLRPAEWTSCKWDDIFVTLVGNASDGTHLVQLLHSVFTTFAFGIVNEEKLNDIIESVRVHYLDNPYHNFAHAVHVVLNCAFFVLKAPGIFSPVEIISLLYAALIHDAGHLGIPNAALVLSGHDLAITYHDQSVAEMNSIAVGLEILRQPHFGILESGYSEDMVTFRKFVIELVLSTDIADSGRRKLGFLKMDESVTPEGFNVETENSRLSLLTLILRAADIGSGYQSFETQKIWAKRFFQEINKARITNGGPEIEPENFHRDQIRHMESYVGDLAARLVATNAFESTFIEEVRRNNEYNVQEWKRIGIELVTAWIAEAKAEEVPFVFKFPPMKKNA